MHTSNDLRRMRSDYAVAFHRYASRREETALRSAYEIGRASVAKRLSLLDLAEIHHSVVFDALRGASETEFDAIAATASRFFAEVLATFEMTTRGFVEHALEHEHAASSVLGE
jgi:hypothetical protein